MARITTQLVSTPSGTALGLGAEWSGGQFVVIVAERGLVACGAIDVRVMEEFGAAVAVAKGTPQSPLRTPDDLLAAKVLYVTAKAKERGIMAGMTGKEALEMLVK